MVASRKSWVALVGVVVMVIGLPFCEVRGVSSLAVPTYGREISAIDRFSCVTCATHQESLPRRPTHRVRLPSSVP